MEKNIMIIIRKKIDFFINNQFFLLLIIGVFAFMLRLYYFEPDVPLALDNLIYLFKMKALCKKHKVNLFLIRSPLPQHVSFSNESTFINIKETFFSDIAFLDFKDYPMNLCFFADNQHLNRKGGIEFSHFFNDSIVPNGLIDKSSLLKKAK